MFCAGRVAALEDYRELVLVKDGKRKALKSLLRQDKGMNKAGGCFLHPCKKVDIRPFHTIIYGGSAGRVLQQ